MNDDHDLIAALFVSEEGEIVCRPEWIEDCLPHWPWQPLPFGIPIPLAAGILRLIRERDEARYFAEQHGNLRPFPWENHRCPE